MKKLTKYCYTGICMLLLLLSLTGCSVTVSQNSEAKEQYKYEDMINIDLAVAGRIWENAGNGEFVIAIANEPKYNMRFKEKGW